MPRPNEYPPKWSALVEALGGVEELADACAVKKITIYRWANGITELSGPATFVVRAVAAKHRVKSPV